MRGPWTILAVFSLVAISLFSIYVAGFTSQGIMCSYVTAMPYFLPISFVLGFLFGYAIPQITKKDIDPKTVAELFEGDEKVVILAALENKTQTEVSEKIGKVRAFRIIRKLSGKGLIEREGDGNTFRLKAGKRLEKLIK